MGQLHHLGHGEGGLGHGLYSHSLKLGVEAIDAWLTLTIALGALTISTKHDTLAITVDAFTLCAA